MIWTWKQFHMVQLSKFPKGLLMWLGLGHPWGWLALTGHHWPPLTKQVIHKSIKDKFKPISSVWLMIWLLNSYVSIISKCCASDYWEMSPNLPFPSPSIPFYSIASVECYIVGIEGFIDLFAASIKFRSISSEALGSFMLTALASHDPGLLPLVFGASL